MTNREKINALKARLEALGVDVHSDGKFAVALSTLYPVTGIKLVLHHVGRDSIVFQVLDPSLGHNNPAPALFEMSLLAFSESFLYGILMELKVEVLDQLEYETAHKVLAAVEWELPKGAEKR